MNTINQAYHSSSQKEVSKKTLIGSNTPINVEMSFLPLKNSKNIPSCRDLIHIITAEDPYRNIHPYLEENTLKIEEISLINTVHNILKKRKFYTDQTNLHDPEDYYDTPSLYEIIDLIHDLNKEGIHLIKK